eukprot:scaffold37675_cov27-Tisochrysis_lutea.AAC.2
MLCPTRASLQVPPLRLPCKPVPLSPSYAPMSRERHSQLELVLIGGRGDTRARMLRPAVPTGDSR